MLYFSFIYILFVSFCLLFLSGLYFISKRRKIQRYSLKLDDITLLIPFKNEESNLPQLLSALSKQSEHPSQIIFVDDHSSDASVELISKFIEGKDHFQLLSLPTFLEGKKAALNYAIQSIETEYIYTIDADVSFEAMLFSSLATLPSVDLISLPVKMNGSSWIGKLAALEYHQFNALNYLLSAVYPISISGANLLAKVNKKEYQIQLENHKHIASGDDYFLLKDMRMKRKDIMYVNSSQMLVETPSPNTFKKYLIQRVRWLSKTKSTMEWGEAIIGFNITFYFLGGFFALIISGLNQAWDTLFLIFCLRFLIDGMVYVHYTHVWKHKKEIFLLPSMQFVYPILFLVVFILSLFYIPSWKVKSIKS